MGVAHFLIRSCLERAINKHGPARGPISKVKELLYQSIKSEFVHSDEGLKLQTSVFESFTVANLPYRPCG